MNHEVALVWVLYGEASCREASRIRILVCGGLTPGMSILCVTVYVLFSRPDVEFQGRPQRPELIKSQCGKESPPSGKRWKKLSACRGRHGSGLPQEALVGKAPRDLVSGPG